jgi:hypothetical protein
MAMVPFSQRTSSGIPGLMSDFRRISCGITNLPARSMFVFMYRNCYLLDCLPTQTIGSSIESVRGIFPVFIDFSPTRVGEFLRRKKLHEFSHVVDFIDPT